MLAAIIEQTEQEIRAEIQARREERERIRQARREAARLENARAPGQEPWPTHLPVREVERPLPDEERHCPDCGQERKVLRYEQSWTIERHVRTEVVVVRTPVAACPAHHGGPVSMPAPPKPVDRGQVGFSLAAWALHLRIAHQLPVRRVAELLQGEGAPVSENMLHELIATTGERFEPVALAIRERVRRARVVNIDDTHTSVYPEAPKGKEFSERLGPIEGVLQGDGYEAYAAYASQQGIQQAGCMAHVRRLFRRALEANDHRAST